MKKLTSPPTLFDIQETHQKISPFIHRTPVMTSETINNIVGAEIFFKCENFQKIGAFKMRGAASAALRLTEKEKENGLATHSSGNHAQAVARAAQILNIPAYIVMPENAPSIKQLATRGYGAKIIHCAPTTQAREEMLAKVVNETGATFIHPYNDYNVIAGQATAVKELLEELPNLNALFCPIGGGGLASGTALYTYYTLPSLKVFGTEPEQVDDAFRSLKSGKIEENQNTNTLADGLRTTIREKTFSILKEYLEEILLVSEDGLVEAMRLIWERMKIIIEPSCAVPLAAILKNKERFKNQRLGVILTGGNVDLSKLPF